MRLRYAVLLFLAAIPVGCDCRQNSAEPKTTAVAELSNQVSAPTEPVPFAGSPSTGKPSFDFDSARRDVETTIARDPKVYELRIRAAEFYMRSGVHASAIPHLRAAARLQPKEIVPWIGLGDAATLSRKFAIAEDAYGRAEKIEPQNPLLIRGRGQLYVVQEKFDKARQVLERGLKSHPNDSEIRYALANLLQILHAPRRAAQILKPAVEQNPERADLHFLLGEIYARDHHVNAAIEEMREALRLDPSSAAAAGRIGLYSMNLTRYAEAREALQQAIKLDPGESHYYWAIGDSYALESSSPDSMEKAAANYRKALALDPKNAKALSSYAVLLTRRGKEADLEEAIGILQRLVTLHPDDANAEYKLYETFRRLGRNDEAEKHRRRFQVAFSKERRANQDRHRAASFKDTAEAHLKLARSAMGRKDFSLAATEFRLALDRDRASSEARAGLLAAQRKLGLTGAGE